MCYTYGVIHLAQLIMTKRFLIVGNWKMNPLELPDAESLLHSLSNITPSLMQVTVLSCVPHVFLAPLLAQARNYSNYHVGAQDAIPGDTASATGSTSMGMLAALGVSHVLVGHSERRAAGDTDEIVNAKLRDAMERELVPILIVGEEERGKTKSYLNTVKKQLDAALDKVAKKDIDNLIFAYEPVWAVGSKAKRECTPLECAEVVGMMRDYIEKRGLKGAGERATILFGGSTDDKNIRGYLDEAGVDGVLVGRASLDPRMIGLMLRVAEDVATQAEASE